MSLLMFTFRSETEAAILTWKPDPVSPLCSFSSCFLLPVLPPLVFFLPSLLYLISVSAPSTKAASTNVLTPGKISLRAKERQKVKQYLSSISALRLPLCSVSHHISCHVFPLFLFLFPLATSSVVALPLHNLTFPLPFLFLSPSIASHHIFFPPFSPLCSFFFTVFF